MSTQPVDLAFDRGVRAFWPEAQAGTNETERFNTVIIGGGQAGLSAG